MLRVGRGTQEYMMELDRLFKSTPLMSEGLATTITKVYEDIEESWERDEKILRRGLHSFSKKLIKALSVPIPQKYVGKRRPALRKFPFYMDKRPKNNISEPHLKDTWHMSISKPQTTDDSRTVIINYGFESPHAYMTNDGWNSSRPVHWLHWADRVLDASLPVGTLHSAKVPDIRAVLLGYYGKSW